MAFVVFTLVGIVIFLICIILGGVTFFEEPFTALILVLIAVVVAVIWFQFNSNRDTSRDDNGRIVAITEFIDRPAEYMITQPDGYRAQKVTCVLSGKTQCNNLRLGDTVTVRTTYNSVGAVDFRNIVVTPLKGR